MKKMAQKLIELDFVVSSKGFYYWLEAIEYSKQHPAKGIGDVYNYIAGKYDDTYVRVEKAMRDSRRLATGKIQKEYHYFKGLTNHAVLRILRLEDMEED